MRLLLPLILSVALPSTALAQTSPSTTPAGDVAVEGAKLRQIFADSDEAKLKRNPVEAIFAATCATPIGSAIT